MEKILKMPQVLKEIYTFSYQYELTQPFSIQKSSSGVFSIMTKQALHIMYPDFKFNPDLNLFNLKPFVVKCPLNCPTNDLETEEIHIYNSAGKLKRQELLLDQRLFPKLINKHLDELVQSRAVAWNEKDLVAYLSNYGGLELFQRIPRENEWKSVVNIGNEYFNYVTRDVKFPLKSIEEFENVIHDLLITNISFCHVGSSEYLIGCTKSDKIIVFKFDSEQNIVEIISNSCLAQHHVTVIKEFPYVNSNRESILVVGSLDGQICIYKITESGEINLQCYLWNEKDQLATTSIEISLIDGGFLVVASKGGFILAFHLNTNLSLMRKNHAMLSPIQITGIVKINESSYFASILTGKIFSIQINVNFKEITINHENVQLDLNLPGCSFYGISASNNKAYMALVSFVTDPHDHLTLRKPLNVTICRLLSQNPMKMLLNEPSKNISYVSDFCEVVRYLAAKDLKILQGYEDLLNLTENIGITREFEYKLKISIVLAGARYTYFRLRSNAEAEVCFKRLERLCQILELIRSIHVLQVIQQKNERKNNLTTLELKSSKYLRLSILEYVSQKPVTQELIKIYDELTPELVLLTQEMPHLSSVESEHCQICDVKLENDALRCQEGHFVTRCCITKIQIDVLNHKMCPQCNRCSINETELEQLVGNNEKLLLCPLCDISLNIT